MDKTTGIFRADADSLRLSGRIDGGLCWDTMTRQRMKDPKALESYGFKVYSQNDEDGILQEIFRRIGTTDCRFVEFGVQDGLECNSHYLLFKGWSGLWIEGDQEYVGRIQELFRPVLQNGQLQVRSAFITKDNINSIIAGAGFSGQIDLLSIDIDGNDYYVWEAIDVVLPRVVVIEYNGKFPPDLEWKMAYDADHFWRCCDWHGASLKSLELLGRKKGYRLVGTGLGGVNAFFVRNDLAGSHFMEPATAEALYNPLRSNLNFVAMHPAKYCLVGQKEGLGLLNYRDYDLCSGFHEEESWVDGTHVWTAQTTAVMKFFYGPEPEMIELPLSLPEEVLKKNDPYVVIVTAEDMATKEVLLRKSFDLPAGGGIFHLSLPARSERGIALLKITVPCLWRPIDLLGTPDTRFLGIDLQLSGIKILPSQG